MKAITLYQPWASLVAVGAKKFETRSWSTSYRGPIAIHASKKHPYHSIGGIIGETTDAMLVALGGLDLRELPLGVIVATAELVGCWHTYGRAEIICCGNLKGSRPGRINDFVSNDDLIFGDFSRGRFAWELENIKQLQTPIPVRGMQGLWEWDEVGLR